MTWQTGHITGFSAKLRIPVETDHRSALKPITIPL
jgi:hypothetical protein